MLVLLYVKVEHGKLELHQGVSRGTLYYLPLQVLTNHAHGPMFDVIAKCCCARKTHKRRLAKDL